MIFVSRSRIIAVLHINVKYKKWSWYSFPWLFGMRFLMSKGRLEFNDNVTYEIGDTTE